MNHKRLQITNAILRKKNKSRVNMLPGFRLYYKAIIIKTVRYYHKETHIDQQNRIKSSEINPCTYFQLIFDKRHKNIQQRYYNLFNKWCCKNWTVTCKRIILEGFPGGTVDRNLPASVRDTGLIPGPGRFHMLQATKPVHHYY